MRREIRVVAPIMALIGAAQVVVLSSVTVFAFVCLTLQAGSFLVHVYIHVHVYASTTSKCRL